MAQSKDSIHKDHRKRVKNRFRKEGLDHFDPVHVLELLLFYGIPQGDTNPLAHRLIEHFGSFSNVLEAPAEELEKVPGVGEHVSTLLTLTRSICRYYMVNRTEVCRILETTTDCGEYVMPYFMGKRDEVVYLLCLDSKCKALSCKEIAQGNVNSVGLSVRKIVEEALAVNAASVILAHNHPSGLAIPSVEDVVTTRRIATALDAVGIVLADHIVVSEDEFVSVVDSGWYNPDDCKLVL